MKGMSDYHVSVLLKESVEKLITDKEGVYVDVTYGGGGHAREILNNLGPKGVLIVFDQDGEAAANGIDDSRIVFVKSNFRYLYRYWKWLGFPKVDGVLADLGVSSHQFDADYRGFSYRFDAALDMRMNEESLQTAEDILLTYTQEDLQVMFSKYGEIQNSKTLARVIVEKRRMVNAFASTKMLNRVLEDLKVGDRNKYLAQVYQALRIEVNDEFNALGDMLEDTVKVMKVGGKLVVLSYHSLEDRIVKRFMKSGSLDGKVRKDDFGRSLSKIKMLGKIVIPDQNEQEINSRSKSAKMRVAERIELKYKENNS